MLQDPRGVFNQTFEAIGHENDKVLAVSCDSALGAGMKNFITAFPKRYIEIGISEQTALSACAGLADQGFKPVLSAITPFVVYRSYEQIRNNIGYAKTNVTFVGSGAGLAYSTLGSSHEAVEDISVMRTIPNLVILAPGDAYEVSQALELAVNYEGPVYIRMPRQALEDIKRENKDLIIGKSETLRQGGQVLVLTFGTMVNQVLCASEILNEKGLELSIEEFMTVKPIDKEKLSELCSGYDHVVTVEEHSKVGGFGSYVSELLSDSDFKGKLHIMGVEEGSKRVGPYHEIIHEYGLSGERIAEEIQKVIA